MSPKKKKDAIEKVNWHMPVVPKEDQIDKRCAPLLTQCAAIKSITSEDHFIAAGALIPRLDEATKWIEAVSDPFVKAMHALHKKAVAFRDRKLDPLSDQKERLLNLRLRWRQKQEEERSERDRAEAERLQKKAKEELRVAARIAQRAGDTETAEVMREAANNTPLPIVHSEPAVPKQEGMYIRERWVHKIVNPAAVKREYCSPDDAIIRPLVAKLGPAAVEMIGGITVENEVKEHSRAVPA
jgi:hypothetical protein